MAFHIAVGHIQPPPRQGASAPFPLFGLEFIEHFPIGIGPKPLKPGLFPVAAAN